MTLFDMKGKRKVVSLIRVSDPGQAKDDRTGIPRQLEDIAIHCNTHNLEVVKEYRLEGLSGANVRHSPTFREMLTQLSTPSIAGIVFASLDRFFRPEELEDFGIFEPFTRTRKLMFCDLGQLDTKNQDDQFKIAIYGKMAGMERARIKDRTRRGRERNRYDPNRKSDPLPLGVEFKDGKFHYTEDSERVRLAFDALLKNESMGGIATKYGFSSKQAMKVTLSSYWWIGYKASTKIRKDHKIKPDGKYDDGKKVLRETPIMVETNLAKEPLVSRETFEVVLAARGRNPVFFSEAFGDGARRELII